MPVLNSVVRQVVRAITDAPGTRVSSTPPTRGPELVTTAFGSWTMSGATVTQDATGITFTAGASGDNARVAIVTEDNVTYEVIWTVANYSAGNCVAHLYGPTSAHHGNGATVSANGTFTQQITTTGASSILSQIRFICGATSTFKITACSVKKVLA